MRLIFVFFGTVCYDVLSAEFFFKNQKRIKKRLRQDSTVAILFARHLTDSWLKIFD